jgi:hypothetical protein
MTASAEDVIKTLQSIDASLKALCGHLGASRPAASQPATDGANVAAMASEADLDSQYGNPPVKAKDPRDWTGDSQVGKRLSECPPAYLDMVAARLDYFAGREEDPKKARYNRLDAARARGWAARLRNGWKPPVEAEPFGGMDANDIPFGTNGKDESVF